MSDTRPQRQLDAYRWGIRAFGVVHMTSRPQRAVRFLEEAVEAYQAAGADKEMAHRLVDYVFSRPVGDLAQELGGCGLTLLLFAQAADMSADQCEARELARVLSKPASEFARRNQDKNEAGFAVAAGYTVTHVSLDDTPKREAPRCGAGAGCSYPNCDHPLCLSQYGPPRALADLSIDPSGPQTR